MKEKKTRSYAIIALVAAVLTLTIAFAALNETLTIVGTARIRGSTWNVAFSTLSDPILTGEAQISAPAQLSAGGTSMSYGVVLYEPGDSVVYNFLVQNFGTINAKVSAISLTGLHIDDEIIYTLTYADGTSVAPGDLLDANTSRALRLTIEFDANSESVPIEDIILSLGAVINYVQN